MHNGVLINTLQAVGGNLIIKDFLYLDKILDDIIYMLRTLGTLVRTTVAG